MKLSNIDSLRLTTNRLFMLFDLKEIIANQYPSSGEAACLCEIADVAGRIDQRGESQRLFLALAVFACPDDLRRRFV